MSKRIVTVSKNDLRNLFCKSARRLSLGDLGQFQLFHYAREYFPNLKERWMLQCSQSAGRWSIQPCRQGVPGNARHVCGRNQIQRKFRLDELAIEGHGGIVAKRRTVRVRAAASAVP